MFLATVSLAFHVGAAYANQLWDVACPGVDDCWAVGQGANYVTSDTIPRNGPPLAVLSAPASGYPRPGITERVSVGMDGTEANGMSQFPTFSADGRSIAFHSFASNFVPDDTIFPDVFVEDRATGTILRASVAPDGAPADGVSYYPSLSADGRYVAFTSSASNLVAADTNGVWDIFVRDHADGTTRQASVGTDGTQGNDHSSFPSISADGRTIAFHSPATNLVAGDTNAKHDVFVRDLAAGTLERISLATDGSEGNDSSMYPSISADGRYVAFQSLASNLALGDLNRNLDVFVHDRVTRITERVSVGIDGVETTGGSFNAVMSPDGRYLLFDSSATNLVPQDSNEVVDVFLRDLAGGTTERISVSSEGAQGDERSALGRPASSVSADGRYVVFQSLASQLVPGDTNGKTDVFVRDRVMGTTRLASPTTEGIQGNGDSSFASVTADGRLVVFQSSATNLVADDDNGRDDVFVHDRGGPLDVVGKPTGLRVPGGVAVSGRATFSGTILAEATDLDDDALAPLGADLTGAALIHRPEEEDLLLRLDLSSLPVGAGGAPGVLYGAELRVGATRFEVRALRASATADPPGAPHAALYRCAPSCIEHASLAGSIGTSGQEVLLSVPLSALGAEGGTELTGLGAFTAAGEAASGSLLPLDEVPLASSEVPGSRVEIGIAASSTPEDQVAFTVEADPMEGSFSGTVPTAGLSPGGYRVWARACLGTACGPAAFGEVTL